MRLHRNIFIAIIAALAIVGAVFIHALQAEGATHATHIPVVAQRVPVVHPHIPVKRIPPAKKPVVHPVSNPYGVTALEIAEWAKVSVCENGPGEWRAPRGSWYPDSLGINATNWRAFGGGSNLTPAAQTAVAERLVHYYHAGIPDQYGCSGAW